MQTHAANGGLRLLGIDVPNKVADGKLRVFVAVERCSEDAPAQVALIVRNKDPKGEVRAGKVVKAVPVDGASVAVGIELPFNENGIHSLQVSVCSADAHGAITDSLFQAEYDNVQCIVESPRAPMPRLDQKDALVLCGVDIPTIVAQGKMQLFVALKRVWHDAPRDVALIVRDKLPNGDRRAAVVYRTLGDDAEPIGMEVPMGEAGVHELTVQVAKVVKGEMHEVFRIDGRKVQVTNPPPTLFGENANIRLCGIDVPTQVDGGSLRAIVAVQRSAVTAPRHLCLIARNTLPDGTTRASMVKKVVHEFDTDTIGMEVPLGEAGDHWLQFSVAECTEDGLVEIFHIPARHVKVTNPPMPRLAEQEAVVLCGVDVQGGRWPHLATSKVRNGTMRVIMALARTWDDAPDMFALVVRDLSMGRTAVVRKHLPGTTPATIGLDVPMTEPGRYLVEVSVAAIATGGQLRTLFTLPPATVEVVAAPAPALVVPKAVTVEAVPRAMEEQLVEVVTPVKVTLNSSGVDSVIRRLSLGLRLRSDGTPVGGFQTVMASVSAAFKADLKPVAPTTLTYRDEDGDAVVISSDHELGIALQHRAGGPLLRMTLIQ